MQTIGAIIKQARTMRGLTQERLSELSGVSRYQISNIELGKINKPTICTLMKLTQCLELDLEAIRASYEIDEINYELPLGEIIRQARTIKGLTQERLSELSGVSRYQISNIELGKNNKPTISTLMKLTQCLNLDIEAIRANSKTYEINYEAGEIIRQARIKKGFTQKKLSELTTITSTQIYKIESGRTQHPNLYTLTQIAQCLKLDLDTIRAKFNTNKS